MDSFPQAAIEKTRGRVWLDRAWLAFALCILLAVGVWVAGGRACTYLATDFRGYYAAGLIARQAGLAAVYDPRMQGETQAALLLDCPDGSATPPRLQVLVPYLPVFNLLFLPLPALGFSNAFAAWSLIGLLIFLLYLIRFSLALAGRLEALRLAQWALCFPVMANVFLGQINFLLVIALGEFFLASRRGRPFVAGLWLAVLLIQPHVLILLLPGLLIARRWKTLLGFGVSGFALLLASLLLVGTSGLQAGMAVVRSFAGETFASLPEMMNARGLAFNLGRVLPSWIAWALAAALMIATALVVLSRWRRFPLSDRSLWLMLATLAGTCVAAWHANLYLWVMLVPFLLALDSQRQLPLAYLAVWAFGPAVVFVAVYLLSPALAQPALAMAMLAVNVVVVVDAGRRMEGDSGSVFIRPGE